MADVKPMSTIQIVMPDFQILVADQDMDRCKIISASIWDKITARLDGRQAPASVPPISGYQGQHQRQPSQPQQQRFVPLNRPPEPEEAVEELPPEEVDDNQVYVEPQQRQYQQQPPNIRNRSRNYQG